MEDKIEIARHSLSHVLAAAILKMFPEAKLGIGPAIENGFYYDFDLPRTLIPEDLPLIEEEMRKIISDGSEFEKIQVPVDEALGRLEESGEPYKCELVEDLKDAGETEVTLYKMGEFVDLCKGPHVENTSELKDAGWKLDKIAGAYWKGSEKNKMLQRVYGLAFESQDDLGKYLKQREEAEKRDHRRIGADLDLFSFHEEGPGFPFWHNKGMILWNALLEWWRVEHKAVGYEEVKTPIILSKDMWERSGHWDHYKNNMYFTKIDERDFAVKPMNCPGGIILFKEKLHSYRELPLKVAEIGLVHRHELAGTLHGLMRVRAFHQDDAHVFCTEEQIADEVNGIIDLADKMYGKLGLKYHLELSTRPEEGSIGSDEMWKKAESALKSALETKGLDYKVNPGDGAFYGPKIDFHIEDAIGRTWQTGTIQLDFAMPERFDLEYISEDGSPKRPVMLHRVIFGSVERFIGIMTEHFAGDFPNWLAPVQIQIAPVSEKHYEQAEAVKNSILDQIPGARVNIDQRNESVSRKVREAELQKVPFTIVVGDREKDLTVLPIRRRDGSVQQISIEELAEELKK